MRRVLRTSGASVLCLLMLLCATTAQAALVNFSLTGYVDGSEGAYGLDVGDTITASGTFDDSAIFVSPYTVYFDAAHSGNSLTLYAGSLTLSHTQDDYFTVGGSPRFEFDEMGGLTGVNFYAALPDYSTFESGVDAFILNDADFNFVTGYWDLGSFTMTPVPVPAAVWLMSSGLLGLAGLARRRRGKN